MPFIYWCLLIFATICFYFHFRFRFCFTFHFCFCWPLPHFFCNNLYAQLLPPFLSFPQLFSFWHFPFVPILLVVQVFWNANPPYNLASCEGGSTRTALHTGTSKKQAMCADLRFSSNWNYPGCLPFFICPGLDHLYLFILPNQLPLCA